MAIDLVSLPQVQAGVVGPNAVRPGQVGGPQPTAEDAFERRLQSAIDSVSDAQNTADVRLGRLASGEEADIHTTMIAMQEADISLRLMVATRDKVVEAYQTVMSISI